MRSGQEPNARVSAQNSWALPEVKARSKKTRIRTKGELIYLAMFAELSITSNFTFLTGASHPEELVLRAEHRPGEIMVAVNSLQ